MPRPAEVHHEVASRLARRPDSVIVLVVRMLHLHECQGISTNYRGISAADTFSTMGADLQFQVN